LISSGWLAPFGFSKSSAIDDLRDLEVGIDLHADAHELALALEDGDPVAEIVHRL
jgi:hypothetical protein